MEKYTLREVIAKHFDYSLNFEFIDVVESILGRVEGLEDSQNVIDTEDIIDALNDDLIYYADQWTVLQFYCTPQDADWDYAVEQLINDLIEIAYELGGEEDE